MTKPKSLEALFGGNVANERMISEMLVTFQAAGPEVEGHAPARQEPSETAGTRLLSGMLSRSKGLPQPRRHLKKTPRRFLARSGGGAVRTVQPSGEPLRDTIDHGKPTPLLNGYSLVIQASQFLELFSLRMHSSQWDMHPGDVEPSPHPIGSLQTQPAASMLMHPGASVARQPFVSRR